MNLIYIFLSFVLGGSTSAKFFHEKAYLRHKVLKKITFDTRISITDAPFMAAIEIEEFFTRQKISTATIISSRFLTTAASSLKSKSVDNLVVLTGVTNLASAQFRNKHRVKTIHTQKLKTGYNDIGLIELYIDIAFNQFQKPIALLRNSDLVQLEETGEKHRKLHIFGYGMEYINTFGEENCTEELCVKTIKKRTAITELLNSVFALTSGPISCSSHYGTPAILDGKLAGVASYDISICRKKNCPGLFTGIVHHLKWILKTVGSKNLINVNKSVYQ